MCCNNLHLKKKLKLYLYSFSFFFPFTYCAFGSQHVHHHYMSISSIYLGATWMFASVTCSPHHVLSLGSQMFKRCTCVSRLLPKFFVLRVLGCSHHVHLEGIFFLLEDKFVSRTYSVFAKVGGDGAKLELENISSTKCRETEAPSPTPPPASSAPCALERREMLGAAIEWLDCIGAEFEARSPGGLRVE